MGEWLRDALGPSSPSGVILGVTDPAVVSSLAELDVSDDGERDLTPGELEAVAPMLAGVSAGRNGRAALPARVGGVGVDEAMTLGELSVDPVYLAAEIPSSNAVASARGMARVENLIFWQGLYRYEY